MAKKPPIDPRRAKLDELRARQKADERKRSMLFIGIAVVVGLGLVAAAAVPIIQRNSQTSRDTGEFGVSASAASCGEIMDDPATGASEHVGEGTPTPDVTRVEYETSPPSSGQHFAFTAGFAQNFYTRDDTPELEQLVHNLEHGATIVWYDEDVSDADVEELELFSDKIIEEQPKLIVAAWDSESRGEFPAGDIAMSHWTIGTGHRQYCGEVSGEAISDFANAYPYTDSPEPNGG